MTYQNMLLSDGTGAPPDDRDHNHKPRPLVVAGAYDEARSPQVSGLALDDVHYDG